MLPEAIIMQINTMWNQLPQAWIILNRKTVSKAQVMLWKMSITRCCKTVRLSMHSCHYPIRLPVFLL
jgi:hypothetical protein